MTEEEALALRDLYRVHHPEITSFWIDLGRQAHWELTVEGLCGHNPQRLLPSPISFSDFQASLLQSIASSLGLTYEQMAQDYTSAEQSAIAESERFWRAFYRHEAETLARLREWFQPFYDRIYREVSREFIVHQLCGYDPQRLLADQRSSVQRFADDWCRSMDLDFRLIYGVPYEISIMNAMFAVAIDDGPDIRRLLVGEVEITTRFIRAGGYGGKSARVHMIDEIDDMRDPVPLKISAPRRQPDYLKHDPTKRHRRRRK